MKVGLTAALAACLAGSIALPPAPVSAAQPSSDETERAKELYREGEKAYRVGKFDVAVQKFEEAYQLSGLPTILYNIGLAYTRRYEVTEDIGDLRQAKAVLQNFYIETQKDPELGDPVEVEKQLAELDEKLGKAEELERQQKEAERKRQEQLAKQGDKGENVPKPPSGPDPGRKLRLAGIGAMAGGGGVFAGGAVMFAFFLVKGQQFSEELKNNRADQDTANCNGMPINMECAVLLDAEQTTIDNGRLANTLSVFVGVPLAVVGVAGVVAGAVVYVRGDRKTKAWQDGRVVLVPTPGGLVLSGRF
jgi:tetratricopeptide (TPR) repeat protein